MFSITTAVSIRAKNGIVYWKLNIENIENIIVEISKFFAPQLSAL